MSDSDAAQIQNRLTTLEVQVIERWTAHDKRSDERWADLMEQFHELKGTMAKRPCVEHEKLMLGLNDRIRNLETWVDKAGWAIGVIYVAIIGAVVKLLVR
jgi:hypothetical protein